MDAINDQIFLKVTGDGFRNSPMKLSYIEYHLVELVGVSLVGFRYCYFKVYQQIQNWFSFNRLLITIVLIIHIDFWQLAHHQLIFPLIIHKDFWLLTHLRLLFGSVFPTHVHTNGHLGASVQLLNCRLCMRTGLMIHRSQ